MIEVAIGDPAWTAAAPAATSLAEAAAAAALATTRDAGQGTLAVLLTDDASVRSMNARFRGQDRATNVLSFPPGGVAGDHLGDVALAYGVCAAEASAQGKPLAHHLQHLVVHGVLHLLGHDHQADAEAQAMEALERRVLAGLGVPDPYAAAASAPHG
jgi:probable rRNA maturation factor